MEADGTDRQSWDLVTSFCLFLMSAALLPVAYISISLVQRIGITRESDIISKYIQVTVFLRKTEYFPKSHLVRLLYNTCYNSPDWWLFICIAENVLMSACSISYFFSTLTEQCLSDQLLLDFRQGHLAHNERQKQPFSKEAKSRAPSSVASILSLSGLCQVQSVILFKDTEAVCSLLRALMSNAGDGVRSQRRPKSRCSAALFQPDCWRPHHAITHTVLSTRSVSSKSLSPKWLKQENAERSSFLLSYRWANRVEGDGVGGGQCMRGRRRRRGRQRGDADRKHISYDTGKVKPIGFRSRRINRTNPYLT